MGGTQGGLEIHITGDTKRTQNTRLRKAPVIQGKGSRDFLEKKGIESGTVKRKGIERGKVEMGGTQGGLEIHITGDTTRTKNTRLRKGLSNRILRKLLATSGTMAHVPTPAATSVI